MHTLIVEFELRSIGTSEYEAHCDEIAPAFAEIPGLLNKLWILDRDSGRAGGVYTWADSRSCDAYLGGATFQGLLSNPALANVRHRRFDVLERPTGVTRGLAVSAAA